jgi:hypothetical protein
VTNWTLQNDIDRWIAYFRLAQGVSAERAEFARELLIEWLRLIGALPPPSGTSRCRDRVPAGVLPVRHASWGTQGLKSQKS